MSGRKSRLTFAILVQRHKNIRRRISLVRICDKRNEDPIISLIRSKEIFLNCILGTKQKQGLIATAYFYGREVSLIKIHERLRYIHMSYLII